MLIHLSTAQIKDIQLWYETFGEFKNPAILLIMGNSAQSIFWDIDFCETLANKGFFVIRYDHRDTGLSSCMDYNIFPYNLEDLSKDAIQLLDSLKIAKAHVVGLSMGGSIAYLLAKNYSNRLLTISTLMTSADLSPKNDAFKGRPEDPSRPPQPQKDYVSKVIALNAKLPANQEEKIILILENWKLANANNEYFNDSYWYKLVKESLDRQSQNQQAKNLNWGNNGNHVKAQSASSEPNFESIKSIQIPTLIIHGANDPIFPIEHAKLSHKNIPDSTLVIIKEMGHALNSFFFKEILDSLIKHMTR